MKTLFKGGTIISGYDTKKADLLIENDKIINILPEITDSYDELIDVTGHYLFPGFIDAHTHFKLEVAKTVTADDFYSGTKSAIAGGTTMIIDFATQYKGESLKQAISNWHKKSDHVSSCDYGFHLAISDWNESVSKELEEIIESGITSFKLYMTYPDMFVNDRQIYEILKRLTSLNAITGVHCENMELINALIDEQKNSGHFSCDSHYKSRPALAEAEAVSRLLKIARLADAPVIIVHMSSEESFKEAMSARACGQEIYIETCPQYLILDKDLYDQDFTESSKYICSPPLRQSNDRNALWNGLKNNQIQTLSTDHCSFSLAQKSVGKDDFTKIPNGMPGVETRPVLIYNYGVLTNRISISQMCRLLAENPAKLYGVYPQKGTLSIGSDADIVVWNPKTTYTLSSSMQNSNADYLPYEGIHVVGNAELVYLKGQLVSKNGNIIKECSGSFVKRNTYIPF